MGQIQRRFATTVQNMEGKSYEDRLRYLDLWLWGHFALVSHPLGDLGTTYDVHLGLIGKRIVDFPVPTNN